MNTYYLISGVILGVGFLICISLIMWGKRKRTKGIDNYKKVRDKLTTREPEPEKEEVEEEVEEEFSLLRTLPQLIMGLFTISIVLIVGLIMLDSLSEVLEEDSLVLNVTSRTTESLEVPSNLSLIILLIMVVGVVIGIVGLAFNSVRKVDL